jgi:hypothetical protein
MTHLVDKLDDDQLQDVTEGVDLFDAAAQVVQCSVLVGVYEHHECIALARHVLFALEKVRNQLWRIGNQKVEILEYREYGHDRIASDVTVFVFETRAYCWHQGFE